MTIKYINKEISTKVCIKNQNKCLKISKFNGRKVEKNKQKNKTAILRHLQDIVPCFYLFIYLNYHLEEKHQKMSINTEILEDY